MFELKKWEPIRELSSIQREMDELFKKTFGSLTTGLLGSGFKGEWCPDVDCYTKDGKFIVHADLPGVEPKDVDVTITGNMLTIKGERKSDEKTKKGGYIFRESSYGSFERSMTLPAGVDSNKVHATYKNGVLELTMPVKSEALPKKIKVELTEGKEEEKAA
ncbi:MAG: Hsp20/alpha crystallin family protein [Thermodesulfobacteriota bacterium]|nr:MAG: Hsp20/alpha crystallin family protein [Thermodesulfobacteriota bacterium]